MPTVEKRENERWPSAQRDLTIQLMPGTHGPAEFSAAVGMTILGGEGVIIEGSSAYDGPGNPESILRFNDGCHRLRIEGPIELKESDGRGIRITMSDDIVLRNLTIHDCSVEGIITGGCRNGIYEDITVEDCKTGPVAGYPPDKRHGVYISGNGSGSHVQRLKVRRVLGSALQINGAGMDAIVRDLSAEELEFEHC